MLTLAIHLSIAEIILLQAGAIILGVTFYFYMVSRRVLLQTIKNGGVDFKNTSVKKQGLKNPVQKSAPDSISFSPAFHIKNSINAFQSKMEKRANHPPIDEIDNESISSVKSVILHQQQVLARLLNKIDNTESTLVEKQVSKKETENLYQKIDELGAELEEKEAEIYKLKKQDGVVKELTAQLAEVYQQFEGLQSKITSLEKSAAVAKSLGVELETLRIKYADLEGINEYNQHKLDEAAIENEQLQLHLQNTESKLAELMGNQQRLLKKLSSLQDANSDLQTISESNKMLKTKLKRIGELESLLSMIDDKKAGF